MKRWIAILFFIPVMVRADTMTFASPLNPKFHSYAALLSRPEILFWACENRNLVLTQFDASSSSERGVLVLERHHPIFPSSAEIRYLGDSRYRFKLDIPAVPGAKLTYEATLNLTPNEIEVTLTLPLSRWLPQNLVDRFQRGFARATSVRLQNDLLDYLKELESRPEGIEAGVVQDHEKLLKQREQAHAGAHNLTPLGWAPLILLFILLWTLVLGGHHIRKRLPIPLRQKWDVMRL